MAGEFCSTMAKKRKFAAYRQLERPYTRYSKFRKKSFIRAKPTNKIIRFDMGNKNKNFEYSVKLISNENIQIRDIAIESARLAANRKLEKTLGKQGFHIRIRAYPHHILRENPLAAGAGADRMSTGMKMSFGKAIGVAAQLKKGQILMEANVDKANLKLAITALDNARKKLPCNYRIQTIETPVTA